MRAAGIEVWLDQSELRGGDAWDASIRRQIKTCAIHAGHLREYERALRRVLSPGVEAGGMREITCRPLKPESSRRFAELHTFEARRYVDPATFADIHASLGETDQAVNWYQKAFADRSPELVYAKVLSRLNPKLAANAGLSGPAGANGIPIHG